MYGCLSHIEIEDCYQQSNAVNMYNGNVNI
jgi:hypothetical protein